MQPSITPSPSARAACDHAHRLADAARLRELDVDPVRALGAGCDVGERVAVLVDVDRHRRAALQLRPVRVAGGQRLLAVLQVELRQVLERLVERPRLVDVALQRQVGDASARHAHARRRGRRGRRASASAGGSRARRPSRSAAPCRPDRRARSSTTSAARPAQAEQLVDRQAGQLALQVVERRVERRARGLLARRQAGRRARRARTDRRRARPARASSSARRPSRRSARSAPPRRIPRRRRARTSTWTTSASSSELREIVNVSASRSVTVEALNSTGATLVLPAPVAQGIERSPPERKAAGSIPAGRILTHVAVR